MHGSAQSTGSLSVYNSDSTDSGKNGIVTVNTALTIRTTPSYNASIIGNLYKGGCSLETHAKYAKNSTADSHAPTPPQISVGIKPRIAATECVASATQVSLISTGTFS